MVNSQASSRVVTGDPVAWFVADRVGTVFVPPYTAMGLERDGKIIAGLILNVWTGPDVEVTVAAEPGGLTRGLMRYCAQYVFGKLGCERVTFTTESPEVVNLAKRLGAEPEGLKRHQYGKGRDGIVLGILKADWKLGTPSIEVAQTLFDGSTSSSKE